MKNELFRPDQVRTALGGLCREVLGRPQVVCNVCVDSRKAEEQSLFVALEGERVDGHSFIKDVIKKTPMSVLASSEWIEAHRSLVLEFCRNSDVCIYVVGDPLTGLQVLAESYRNRFEELCVAAITGSNGKTTTKELLAHLLRQEMSVVWNEGNLNSEIGLPLSVFSIRPEHRIAVFEMGMNHVGEMDILVRVARPHVAAVTNIGTAHIGLLGSREAIAEEKKKIFSLFGDDSIGFVGEDDPYREYLTDGRGRYRLFGRNHTDGVQDVREAGFKGTVIRWRDRDILFPLPGEYNLKNAFCALSMALEMGVSENAAAEALGTVKPVFGRSEVLNGRITLVRDCYNANPESMKMALGLLAETPQKGRRIAVLGDMLELGGESESAHRDLGRFLENLGLDFVLFFGPETKRAWEETKRGSGVFHTEEFADLKERLLSEVKEGDTVLLKGSRGMSLERLTEPLLNG